MSIVTASKWIYQNNGISGFYRGVVPRIGLGMWQTLCMVALGMYIKTQKHFCMGHDGLTSVFLLQVITSASCLVPTRRIPSARAISSYTIFPF